MSNIDSISTERLSNRIINFCRFIRSQGLKVGVQESLDALKVAELGLCYQEILFKNALAAILCHCKEDKEIFATLFDRFWHGQDARGRRTMQDHRERMTRTNQNKTSLLMMGVQNQLSEEEEKEDSKTVSGASLQERLRKTDFSKLTEVDADLLEELAQKLWRQMSLRLSRRLKSSQKQKLINLRQTIRKNLQHGGNMIELKFKEKKKQKPKLLVLLDVSGSMDKYSFFLLRFIYALQGNFSQLEAFIFSTELKRITDIVKKKMIVPNLRSLADRADAWASGTKIGNCLDTFYQEYGKRVLSKNTVVVILSDGLDTGESDTLHEAMKQMSKSTKKIIWLNPLKGMQGYEPTAKGMQTALPHLDVFKSAHNLDSLLELEKYLEYV